MMTILRPLLTLCSTLQICRLFAIFLCGGAIGSVSLLDSIKYMERISYRFWIHSYARVIIHHHSMTQILLQWSSNMFHSLVAILKLCGLVSIPLNYVTLKMYGLMPFRLYIAFPIACVLLPLSHQILLPLLIGVYEGEVNLHWNWKRALRFSGYMKYLVRRIKATRILRLYCGVSEFNFYFLKKSTKLKYQYAILSYTISALLSEKG